MDNCTGTTCRQCTAIILYDKDAPKPELCPVCEQKKKERD